MGLLDAIFGNNQPPKINSILLRLGGDSCRKITDIEYDKAYFSKRGEKIHLY